MEGLMLKIYACLLLALLTFLSGCAVKIVPEAVPGGTLSPDGRSLSLTRGAVTITARVVDEEIYNNAEGLITSLQVEINNQGESEVAFDNDSFLLLEENGTQYFAVTPEKVRQMLTKESYYLLPYPYVGFYYLEDYEKSAFKNSTDTTRSSLPYYYEMYPEDLFAKALPMGTVIPKAKVSGLVYFQADMGRLKSFRLQVYGKGSSKSAPPDFVFPFKVVK
jgi:hypothetical protein